MESEIKTSIKSILKHPTITKSRELPSHTRKRRAVVGEAVSLSFKPWLNRLKSMAGIGEKSVDDAVALLKTVDSGVSVADTALRDMPVSKTVQGYLRMGDETVGGLDRIIRQGDLERLIRVSGKDVPITSVDKRAFRRVVNEYPESSLFDLDVSITNNRRSLPELDTTVARMDRLTSTAKTQVKRIESNLFKYFKQGTAVALTIGVIYVGVDWIRKATEARRGCFMLTTINGKTTSCKVQAYSCAGGSSGNMCSNSAQFNSYYNTTLILMRLASLPDDDARKIRVAEAASVPVNQLQSRLVEVIDGQSYELVVEQIRSMTPSDRPAFVICDITHPNIEGGVVPPCRMCSPTADPVSTRFIDSSQYGDNITFQCIEDPSILDTVSDAVVSTGKDLLAGVGSTLGNLFKRVGLYAIIAIVLLSILVIIFRVATSRRAVKSSSSSSAPLARSNFYTAAGSDIMSTPYFSAVMP